jgi:predicted dehydrogenase
VAPATLRRVRALTSQLRGPVSTAGASSDAGSDCQQVKVGIIGVGGMGMGHHHNITTNLVPSAIIAAVCDVDPTRLEPHQGKGYALFADASELISSGLCDAVVIATPHYYHTTLAIAAINAGLHVLTEKPLSVHKADCEKVIAAYESRPDKTKIFSEMFNQRTDNTYLKMRSMVQGGELGELRRVNWIITTWFRTQAYYDGGGWRATWAGEGGGVLTNQCPHQLDLVQWICGMPSAVSAHVAMGKYHDIEVEDEVVS